MQNISALDISQSGVSQSGTTNAPEVGHRNGTSHSDGFVQDLDLLLPTYANNTERQHIERQISNAFFECMGNLIKQNGRAVLLLDAYEEIPQVADTFLHEQLLPRLLHDPWDKLVIIIAGREIPDITARTLQSKTVTTDLQRFNKEYVIEFMRSRNVPEDSTRWTPQSALTFSGGVPGILALIADQALAAIQDEDADFFN